MLHFGHLPRTTIPQYQSDKYKHKEDDGDGASVLTLQLVRLKIESNTTELSNQKEMLQEK